MVRYVDQERATIWLELHAEAAVFGTAKAVNGEFEPLRVESSVARTVEVFGHHYAVLYFEKLRPATLYNYSITALFGPAGPVAWPREIQASLDYGQSSERSRETATTRSTSQTKMRIRWPPAPRRPRPRGLRAVSRADLNAFASSAP